jgi:predicted flap endonuclease-1-like 5' DNA nuclease
MFSVKGIPMDTRYFSPHPRLMAIAEILLMLLVACLIGYAIGLAIRESAMQTLWEAAEELETEKKSLLESKRELTQRLESSKQQLSVVQQTGLEDLARANRKADALKHELSDLKRELTSVKETEASHPASDSLENEVNALRFRAKQFEFKNQELEETIEKLRHELELSISVHARKPVEPMHPFVRPVTEDEKDDLTVIKGIGPFIEKRLNMVGIYTLKQISEFTPETIEQVSKAIEFFPNRMLRDDWVGQAKVLINS